jgi:hypothetical protein
VSCQSSRSHNLPRQLAILAPNHRNDRLQRRDHLQRNLEGNERTG